MDVKEFQKKLAEILNFAMENKKKITPDQMKEFLGEDMDEEQLALIHQYLIRQGVTVEGVAAEAETEKTEADPLSLEEKAYLEEYLEGMYFAPERPGEKEALFSALREGKREVMERISEFYYEKIAELCKDWHKKEYFIGDMIQEMNLRLLLLLGKENINSEEMLIKELEKEIQDVIIENDKEAYQDDILVSKVRNLDAAVKKLTEDEEEDTKYSLEELSLFLDMTEEEIMDVLRLTGDDK